MKKFIRPILWTVFILYSYIVIHLLITGRNVITDAGVWEHICTTTNLVPFKTNGMYIRQSMDGYFRAGALRNLGGNFFLLFPIGILLPCLFPKINRLWKVAFGMTVFIVIAEILQGVLRIGYIDIDDLIFNVIGGILGYGMIKIPVFSRWIQRRGVRSTS